MIDFERRLQSLKDRRQGSRERAIYESFSSDSIARDFALSSGYEARQPEFFENLNEPVGIKYAIGAMAPVEKQSTQVSINEGDRVADSLIKSLNNNGESVTKRLQGSVALDIHIKNHSDVDMLIIVTNPVNIELPVVTPSGYTDSTDARRLVEIARDVRIKSEQILPKNFPTADVDCSGSKSVKIQGGSLKRKIDLVPAIWYDGIKYQQTKQEHNRGIKIYHKENNSLILNYPFTHIKIINERDSLYKGNLKCVIRLMKNLIADMPEYKCKIVSKLSSYDLAAIAYHMDAELAATEYFRLSLVEKTRAHLQLLNTSKIYREILYVPDGTRKIFDSEEKTDALDILTKEFSDLAQAIFEELSPLSKNYDKSKILTKIVI